MGGKREAGAEAEAEPYTIGQVYAGLPVANAIATGHPHNVGVITNMVSLYITVSTIHTWDTDSTDKVSENLSAPDNDCLAIVNDKINKMQYWSFILISTMTRIYVDE